MLEVISADQVALLVFALIKACENAGYITSLQIPKFELTIGKRVVL